IAHAEAARLSRELVKLKNDVPVEEPLDALELKPPDGPKLIGFLKAMEFNSLTRRVAEATGTDAAEIEPLHVEVEYGPAAHGPDLSVPTTGTDEPHAEGEVAPTDRDGRDPANTPESLAAARASAATSQTFDLTAYVTIRDLATLEAWAEEARETGVLAFDTETTSLDPMQAELCGFAIATAPGRAAYV